MKIQFTDANRMLDYLTTDGGIVVFDWFRRLRIEGIGTDTRRFEYAA